MKYVLTLLILAFSVHAQRKTDSPAEETLRAHMQSLLEAEVAEIAAGPADSGEVGEDGEKIMVPGRKNFSGIRPTWWGSEDEKLTAKGLKNKLGNHGLVVIPYNGPRGIGGIAFYYRVKAGVVQSKQVHFGPEVERAKPDKWSDVLDDEGNTYASLEAFRPTPVEPVVEPVVEPDLPPNVTITPTE